MLNHINWLRIGLIVLSLSGAVTTEGSSQKPSTDSTAAPEKPFSEELSQEADALLRSVLKARSYVNSGIIRVTGSRFNKSEEDPRKDDSGLFKMVIVFDHKAQCYRFESREHMRIRSTRPVIKDGRVTGERKQLDERQLALCKMIKTPWNTIDWYQSGDDVIGHVRIREPDTVVETGHSLRPFDYRAAGTLSERSLTSGRTLQETFEKYYLNQSHLISSITRTDDGLTKITWTPPTGGRRIMNIREDRESTVESMEFYAPRRKDSEGPAFKSTAKWEEVDGKLLPTKITIEDDDISSKTGEQLSTKGYQLNLTWDWIDKPMQKSFFSHLTFAEIPDGTRIIDLRRPLGFTTVGYFINDVGGNPPFSWHEDK